MRKATILKMLKTAEDELGILKIENRQLRERLDEAENKLDEHNQESESGAEKIARLQSELDTKCAELDAQKSTAAEEYAQLEERFNAVNRELNKLKGEYFDMTKYSEDLKAKLESSLNENSPEEFAEVPIAPPVVSDIYSAKEKDEKAFDYASSVISKAVVKAVNVKARLEQSGDENSTELITLALGRLEMLKSDVLNTVMSEMVEDAKRQRMDEIIASLDEYYNGLIGQLRE